MSTVPATRPTAPVAASAGKTPIAPVMETAKQQGSSGDNQWDPARYVDGAILQDRSCTDCPCIIIFLIFIVGWIVLLAVAFSEGVPERILMPSNFRGELCGDKNLANYPNFYAPLPNRPTYGFCVPECPPVFSYACNNDVEPMLGNRSANVPNHYYSHSVQEFNDGKNAVVACLGSCSALQTERAQRFSGLMLKLQENKCFITFYTTSATLYRCLPFDVAATNNATLLEQANASLDVLTELADTLGIGSFFMRGFSECEQAWRVILICCFTAVALSLIWIFLLRWVMAPIVYLCIVLVFAVLVLLGILAMLQGNNLEDVRLPGESGGTADQVRVWRAIQYIFFLAAAMYVVAMLMLIKRIRIAIIMMEESSKAFLANPIMAILPLIAMIFLIGFGALFVAGTVFIQTMDDVKFSTFENKVTDFVGERAVNMTELAIASGGSFIDDLMGENKTNSSLVNVTSYDNDISMKGLHAYNFFMFLWVGNFFIMYVFFVMAMIVCTWYFSATTAQMDAFEYEEGRNIEDDKRQGRLKSTAVGTFVRSVWAGFRYHMGTIIFGALLIAIIQFIRAVVLYIEKEFLEKWKDNATVKVLLCCLNCCLACIERIVRAVSKGAFVITCITNDGFCSAAQESLGIMVSNMIQVGTLQGLALTACLILKVLITILNLLIAYGLINREALTDDREMESGLFPLVFIGLISLAIACLFVNIFESCIDTIMMCYFVDEKRFNGTFMPPTLSRIVGKFQEVEKARQQYEDQMKKASYELS